MKDWAKIQLAKLEECLMQPVRSELNELDWKVELSADGNRMAAHLMAMANLPGGGCVVFGIEDATGKVKGVEQDKCAKVLGQLANISRDGVEPPIQLDHAIAQFGSKPILLVRVPESQIKPVHRRGGSVEETYVRSAGTTRKASRQEAGSLMVNSQTPRWELSRASLLLSRDDAIQLLDWETISRLLTKPSPGGAEAVADWLVAERLLEKEADGFYVTNFGAIAAAKKLKDFPSLERKAIRLVRYSGRNKEKHMWERTGSKGYAIGFQGLLETLLDALQSTEVIEKGLRRKVPKYPELALRELIANALIHQDFNVTGVSPMLEIFDDRIEVTSPGRLLATKKIDRLIGTNPESRNEVLAGTFRRFGICEERGTGFQKVVSQSEQFWLPPIGFDEGENYFTVKIYGPKSFKEMSVEDRIEACYQHAVLRHLSNDALTNSSLRTRLKLSDRFRPQVSTLIAEAVRKTRIKLIDPESTSTKFARYVPYYA